MLGLGNSLATTPVIGGPLQMSISIVAPVQLYDSQSVRVLMAVSTTDPLGTLQGFSGESAGDKLGGTYSLKVDRYDDTIANGGSIQATKTLTVYAYRINAIPAFYSYLSDDNHANIAMTNFNAEGSALLDLQDLDGTDITTSGSHLYVFTLTVSGSGYLDAVKSSSEITIDT